MRVRAASTRALWCVELKKLGSPAATVLRIHRAFYLHFHHITKQRCSSPARHRSKLSVAANANDAQSLCWRAAVLLAATGWLLNAAGTRMVLSRRAARRRGGGVAGARLVRASCSRAALTVSVFLVCVQQSSDPFDGRYYLQCAGLLASGRRHARRAHNTAAAFYAARRRATRNTRHPEKGDASTVELEIKVGGMMCGGCTSRVEEALKVCVLLCVCCVALFCDDFFFQRRRRPAKTYAAPIPTQKNQKTTPPKQQRRRRA